MSELISNFINGESRPALDGATYDVIDPTTGQTYAQAALSGEADADLALRSAQKAFETWGDTTPRERQAAGTRPCAERPGGGDRRHREQGHR